MEAQGIAGEHQRLPTHTADPGRACGPMNTALTSLHTSPSLHRNSSAKNQANADPPVKERLLSTLCSTLRFTTNVWHDAL